MSNGKTIVVGFSTAAIASLQELQQANSVVLVEEPDIIRKRNVEQLIEEHSVVDRLIPFECHRETTADGLHAMLRDLEVASVVPIAEYATPFAARLAELFGVPGAGYKASVTMRNKDRLRTVTAVRGIRNPRSQLVSSLEDVQQFAEEIGGPIVIKPANRQASVGVVIVRDCRRLKDAWDASNVREEGVMVPDRELSESTLAEEFISGKEFSVEALASDGKIIFSNVTGKELFEGVHPVERAHTVPAPLTAEASALLVQETQRLVEATGFRTGILHCEWILADDEAFLVECAGRFAGDGIIDLIERAYEFDIVGTYHRLMRGESLQQLPQKAAKTAMVRFLDGPDAEIRAIEVDEEALSQKGIAHYFLSAKVGERSHVPTMSWHRLGSVTVEAATAAAAAALAARALAGINISYLRGNEQ